MSVDEKINGITTIIECHNKDSISQGSGFFFQKLSPRDPAAVDGQWRSIVGLWIITNRHVIFEDSSLPDTVLIYMRQVNRATNLVSWAKLTLDKQYISDNMKVTPDSSIDVVAIDIHGFFSETLDNKENIPYPAAISEEDLPEHSKLTINTTSDVAIIGYPKGFYDKVNNFPIVKSGMISTRFGANFNNSPCYLIDAKLFPGSSGSLIISKPQDIISHNGQLLTSEEKQFVFLGIYSGDPYLEDTTIETEQFTIITKENYNLGVVWYPSVILDIITNGVAYGESEDG